jgi:hypothetical protein
VVGCGHAGDGNVHLSVFQPDPGVRHRLVHDILAAAVALGLARALGETLAVLMLSGNTAALPGGSSAAASHSRHCWPRNWGRPPPDRPSTKCSSARPACCS